MRSCCRRIPGRLLPSSACFLFRRHAQPSMAWGQRRLHRPPRSAGLLPIPLLPPRLALCQPSLCFPRLSSKRYHDCSHPFPLANSLQAHFWIGKDWGSPLSRGGNDHHHLVSPLCCLGGVQGAAGPGSSQPGRPTVGLTGARSTRTSGPCLSAAHQQAGAGPRRSRSPLRGDGRDRTCRDACIRCLGRPRSSRADSVLTVGAGLDVTGPLRDAFGGGSARRQCRWREPPRIPAQAASLPARCPRHSSVQAPGRRSRSPAGAPRWRGWRF